eukprot:PhM_4_TR938/c0_g1_i1/m.87574
MSKFSVGSWCCRPATPSLHVQHVWRDDAERPNCFRCHRTFSWYRRRHHCRLCGEVLCHACCHAEVSLPSAVEFGYESNVRACGVCDALTVGSLRAFTQGLRVVVLTQQEIVMMPADDNCNATNVGIEKEMVLVEWQPLQRTTQLRFGGDVKVFSDQNEQHEEEDGDEEHKFLRLCTSFYLGDIVGVTYRHAVPCVQLDIEQTASNNNSSDRRIVIGVQMYNDNMAHVEGTYQLYCCMRSLMALL